MQEAAFRTLTGTGGDAESCVFRVFIPPSGIEAHPFDANERAGPGASQERQKARFQAPLRVGRYRGGGAVGSRRLTERLWREPPGRIL
jgi:hypothetical protein